MLTQAEIDQAGLRSTGEHVVRPFMEMYVPSRNETYVVEPDGHDQVKVMDGEEVIARLQLHNGVFVVVTDES